MKQKGKLNRRPPPLIAGSPPDPGHEHRRVLILGDSGSGKSALANKALAKALERGNAAVVLDVGGNMRAFVEAKAPQGTPVYDLGPYAGDGVAPNVAELLASETDRQAAAAKLIPDVQGDPNPFFNKSARIVLKKLAAILHAFAPGGFTLGDLIRLARNMKLARALGKATPVGDPWRQFQNDESRSDVHATLLSALEPHSPVAALWDGADEQVSLAEFAREREGVLILPWTDRLSASLEGVYSFLLDTVSDLLLEDLSPANDVDFFLDEFRQLSPLAFIGNVVRRGRKSFCHITATLHEVPGLRDRYNPHRADEMLGMFNYLYVLRCGSVETADWASRRLGEPETITDLPPRHTHPFHTKEGNFSRNLGPRRNVTADQARKNRSVDVAKDRLTGWCDRPSGFSAFECPFLADTTVPERDAPPPRPRSAETLLDFDLDAVDRLDLPATKDVVDAIREFRN